MAFSKQSDFSASFTQDSDEVQEMFCEHCDKHDKKYVPAEGFCEECVEYMCDMCLKFHKRYLTSHTIKGKDSMPQDFCLDKCSTHKDELVKFYCQVCEKSACSECKANYHGNCKAVSHLPTLVEGIEKSEELKDLTENMNELLKELENITENANTNMDRATSQERKVLKIMKQKKEEIISAYKAHQQEIIDDFEKKMEETITRLKEEKKVLVKQSEEKQKKLEKKLNDEEDEIKTKVKTTKEADQKELQSIKEKSLTIRKDLKIFSSDLEQHQNTGQRCKLFLAMKKARQGVGKLKHDSSKLKENNDIHYYTAECTVKKQDVINAENTSQVFCFKELHQSEMRRTAHFHSDIQVRRGGCQSLCLLSESTLLVTIYFTSSLIIVRDIKVSTTSYDTIQMPDQPWAAARVEDYKVAVTLPQTRTVRLMTFSDSMTVINSEDIKVGVGCHGIAYSNNNLIVSFTFPAKVQILDMSGKVLKCFDKDSNGQKLFIWPSHLTLSPDNTIIYVSDEHKNMVLSLTMDGEVKDDQLTHPTQLTVDRSGVVYVCEYGSDNVHQLMPDLTKVKILLDRSQGMNGPVSVAYCQNNKRLYVGMLNNETIKVYNLTLE